MIADSAVHDKPCHILNLPELSDAVLNLQIVDTAFSCN